MTQTDEQRKDNVMAYADTKIQKAVKEARRAIAGVAEDSVALEWPDVTIKYLHEILDLMRDIENEVEHKVHLGQQTMF